MQFYPQKGFYQSTRARKLQWRGCADAGPVRPDTGSVRANVEKKFKNSFCADARKINELKKNYLIFNFCHPSGKKNKK
jgi:hypothetical protein